MARFSAVALFGLVVFVSLVGYTTMAASQKTYSAEEIKAAMEQLAKYTNDDDYKKNEDMMFPLMMLLANGSQFVHCSVVLVMMAAALGVVAMQGLFLSPLHK